MTEHNDTVPPNVEQEGMRAPGMDTADPAANAVGDFSRDQGPAPAHHQKPLGANLLDGSRCEFRVWAPDRERVAVHIVAPSDRRVDLE